MPKLVRHKYRLAKNSSDLCIAITESSSAGLHIESKQKKGDGVLEFMEENTSSYSADDNAFEDHSNYVHDSDSLSDNELETEFVSVATDENNQAFSNNDDKPNDIRSALSQCAIKNKIPHSTMNDLLKILKPYFPNLPSDCRTLLNTPRKVDIKTVQPGQYYHFGLQRCIDRLSSKYEFRRDLQVIEVCVNIDGLPLTKSSSSQLYPILCNLFVNPKVVEIIGIYHGTQKPSDANTFVRDFVNEAIELTNNNYTYQSRAYPFKIKALVCDAPAKSFITYTKSHSGYYACLKCCIKGSYVNNRVCFPETKDLVLRTNVNFKSKIQEEHHTGTTLFELIPNFDMIRDVPLDYMHLICLGVVRKLLVDLWCCGKPPHQLSSGQLAQLSQTLINLSPNIPVDFCRKPRGLNEVKRWKATEFRQFLFYTGPVVLKSVLSPDRYLNFLSLHVATRILANSQHLENLVDYAGSLLTYFVETFKKLYGMENMSYNVHNLLHISSDTKRFGKLDNFSAFPFENHMKFLKSRIRKHHNPLAQIIHRIAEEDSITCNNLVVASDSETNGKPFKPTKEHFRGPLLASCYSPQYEKIDFNCFTLKITEPDNCCLLKDDTLICVENIASSAEGLVVVGKKFLCCDNFYKNPCKSSELQIYIVSKYGPLHTWNMKEVACKCVKLKYKESFVVFPLLHSESQ